MECAMKKIAIVTGGGRGIGAATSMLLASQGYSVCVNYRTNEVQAQAVVDAISSAGGTAFSVQADVSKEADVQNLFAEVNDTVGIVTHLVNNVGVLFSQSTLSDISFERFNQVMAVNVGSCFLCSKAFVNQSTGPGAIVNVSSTAARSGAPFEYIDYAASKGAMDSLTKGLSLELAPKGIRVNAVKPGFIYTDIHADGGEPNRVERLSSQIPLQRGGTADEVANAIAWLLSDEASYITGSFVDVTGGK